MKRILFTLLASLAVPQSWAELTIPITGYASIAEPLAEVVVTAGTNYQVQQTVPPELFNNSIHLQETSPGMKSPYVGVFTGYQVDQTINGVRANNALFRSGPNQYYGWVPDSFVQSVSVSDGGNVGGTISRQLGVAPSHVGLSFDTANRAAVKTGSYKSGIFGVAFSSTDTGNMRTTDGGEVPHSAYNQDAVLVEAAWSANNKTTFLRSRSTDIERTDKWNGGSRSSGYQAPSVYTYELQDYTFFSHQSVFDRAQFTVAYQDSTEHMLDGTKSVQTNVKAYTVNGAVWLTDAISLYSTNTYEAIKYDNGITSSTASDKYVTTKQGIRYNDQLLGFDVIASAGLKQVAVSDLDGFDSKEGSLIVGRNGFFGSVDLSSNAPNYSSLKQSKTSGRGVSIPNPDLKEEQATTWRLGYKQQGLYADVYYKHFTDALKSVTIAKNTYRPTNSGEIDVYGSTFTYSNPDVQGTGIGVLSRLELAYGNQTITDSTNTEPTSKTTPLTAYGKVTYRGAFAELKYAPRATRLSASDDDDVRIYGHNDGYRLVNVGYVGSYDKFDYSIRLNNLFNNGGRVLGSSVDVGERSLVLAARYNF